MTPQFSDPWLADSEWLLSELAKARDQILRISFRLDTQSDIEAATGGIFNLEQRLRYMLSLQRSFAKQHAEAQHSAPPTRKKKSNIVRISA